MVPPPTKRVNSTPHSTMRREDESAGRRLGSEKDENEVGNLQYYRKEDLVESRIGKEAAALHRARRCSRDGASAGTQAQRSIHSLDGYISSAMAAAQRRIESISSQSHRVGILSNKSAKDSG